MVVVVVLAVLGAACSDDGSTRSAPTTALGTSAAATGATSTAAAPTGPGQDASVPGFGEIAFDLTPSKGRPRTAGQFCALLAETEQQHAQGLMGRRDLAGYDAMIFRFAFDTTGAFYMRDVPVGLSIAWFGADGRFVSSTDMAPCPDQDGCPTYAPAGPYRYALEVLEGGLGRLGVGEGSVLTLAGDCRR